MNLLQKITNSTLTAIPQMSKLCQPLLDHFNLYDYAYMLQYPNGHKSILTTNETILTHWIRNNLLSKYTGNITLADILLYGNNTLFFQSDLPKALTKNKKYERIGKANLEIMADYNTNFNVIDRLWFTNKNSTLIEYFIYCFKKEHFTHSSIINNIKLFRYFNLYFKSAGKNLIEAVKYEPLLKPYKNRDNFLELEYKLPFNAIIQQDKISDKIQLNRFYLPGKNNAIYLTKTELLHCTHLLIGLSAREISEICFVSKRTIETHIEDIKEKLGVKNKSDIIGKLLVYGLNNILPI